MDSDNDGNLNRLASENIRLRAVIEEVLKQRDFAQERCANLAADLAMANANKSAIA